MGPLFPALLLVVSQLQHRASAATSGWDHFDALNSLESFHSEFQAAHSTSEDDQQTQETQLASLGPTPSMALDGLESIPPPAAPAPPPPVSQVELPLTPLKPLMPEKKPPSTFLIELGSGTKRSAVTLGTAAAAEARAETREALRALSSERDYYSQQYAGELSRSSALAQKLQSVEAELDHERQKEAQQSQEQAHRLQALQTQVESDQKDMSYQAAWVVQAGDKKLQGLQKEAALYKNRSVAQEQEIKDLRTANKLSKAKEVAMSRKINELQRQNEGLIVEEDDHDQKVGKSQRNLEYAQKQIRKEQKLVKQYKQHSLALEAKLQLLQGAQQEWQRQHIQDQQENARLQSLLKNSASYSDRRIQGVITRASKLALGFQSSEQAWAAKGKALSQSLLQDRTTIHSLQNKLKRESQEFLEEKSKANKVQAELKKERKKAHDLESDADSRQGLEENVDDLEEQNHALESALHAAQADGGRSREQLAELQEQNLELSRDLEAAKLQVKHQGGGKYALALLDISSGGNTGTKDTNPEAAVNDLFRTNPDPLGSLMSTKVARGTSFLDISRSVSSKPESPSVASSTAEMPAVSVVGGGVEGDALSEVEQLLH